MNGAVAVSGVTNEGDLLHGGDGKDNINLRGEAMGANNLGFLSAAYGLLAPSSKTAWEPNIAYGTSLATPLVAGTIAVGLQKFPDATANQVLQAMIRTTGNTGLHEPRWSGQQYGYGIANPTALLNVDPTQYPDENPLFVTSADDPRCIDSYDGLVPTDLDGCAWSIGPFADEVWPAEDSDDQPTAPVEPPTGEAAQWMSAALIVGGVLLFGIIVTAIATPIAVSRSRKRRMQVSGRASS